MRRRAEKGRSRNAAVRRSRGTLRGNSMPFRRGSQHNVPLVQPYERFRAWHACDALVIAVYRATERFPRSELYGLTSQARRAAFSAAANIAEGSAKSGRREFRRYLDIAIGTVLHSAVVPEARAAIGRAVGRAQSAADSRKPVDVALVRGRERWTRA